MGCCRLVWSVSVDTGQSQGGLQAVVLLSHQQPLLKDCLDSQPLIFLDFFLERLIILEFRVCAYLWF